MSYCRFLSADAYIYNDVEYGIMCCWCSITSGKSFIAGSNYDLMISHVSEHRAAGDYIPFIVDKMLLEEKQAEEQD